MVNVLIDIPSKIHSRIKILSAMKNTTMKEIIIKTLGEGVFADDNDGSWEDYITDLLKEIRQKEENI